MKQLLLKSLNERVVIETDNNDVVNFFKKDMLPYIFIPGYSTKIINKKAKPNFRFIFLESNIKNRHIIVDPNGDSCRVYDAWTNEVPTYILSLLQLKLSTLLAKKSILTLHSASVQSENANFVFIGHAGAGKTTVMLDLISKLQYKYIANNKTLVSISNKSTKILGGSAAVSLRDVDLFPQFKKMAAKTRITPYGRVAFTFKSQHLATVGDGRRTFFIILQINSGVSEFHEMTLDEARIQLYPFFLDLIDREIALFAYKEPVPSQFEINSELKKKILSQMNIFLTENKLYHLSGSLEFIRNKIIFLNNSVEL